MLMHQVGQLTECQSAGAEPDAVQTGHSSGRLPAPLNNHVSRHMTHADISPAVSIVALLVSIHGLVHDLQAWCRSQHASIARVVQLRLLPWQAAVGKGLSPNTSVQHRQARASCREPVPPCTRGRPSSRILVLGLLRQRPCSRQRSVHSGVRRSHEPPLQSNHSQLCLSWKWTRQTTVGRLMALRHSA